LRLLWGLDGIIVDTYLSTVDNFCTVYEEVHGEEIHRDEALLWLKRPAHEVFERFDFLESDQERFHALNNERTDENHPLFEGVEELLAEAKVNVIVTSRDAESAQNLLEEWGLLHYFAEIICTDEAGFTSNEETGAYQYAEDKYALEWAIGDSELDLDPAESVGMKICSFRNESIEADLHIEEYDPLLIDYFK